MLSFIVAVSENNVIGSRNELPWYLPSDLKHFSATTTGHTVIMGRNTYDSILSRIGKPLPNRSNIVVTRQADFIAPGCIVVNSLEEALEKSSKNEEVFLIGGAQLYKEAFPLADRLYVTKIHTSVEGDAFFPEFDSSAWNVLSEIENKKDDKNNFDLTWMTYERKK